MKLSTAIEKFTTSRRADGLAERSLADYERCLGAFAAHIGNITVADLDRDAARDYVVTLRANGFKHNTVGIHVRNLRAFWRWLYEEGHHADNLARYVRAPKYRPRNERLITSEEFARLVKSCETSRCPLRDRALLLLLADTGLRRGEVISLRRDGVVWEDDGTAWLFVYMSKSQDNRFAILGHVASRALREYLDTRDDDVAALFASADGSRALGYAGIARMITRRVADCDLDITVHPHMFRKVFATWWVDNGGDEGRLMDMVGWKTPDMLRVYVRLYGRAALQRAHRKFSPVDRAMEVDDETLRDA